MARPPSRPAGSGTRADSPGDPTDEVLAAVLIRMWSLASGRTLRRDVPADQLSTEELIAFWADDMTPPTGRHARPGGTDPAPGTGDPGARRPGTGNPGTGEPGNAASRPAAQLRRRKRRRRRGRAASGRRELPVGPASP
jgi:hypothetical protein